MKLINPEVRIETTNLCNAKCIMCPRDELTRPKASMPYEHCKNLIAQADDLGAELISLFGYGEPLIDTSLGAKIRYCTQLGLKTFITTNASLLSEWRCTQLISNGLSMIRFSMHGLTRETYENVHVGLNFYKVMENIDNFLIQNIKADKPVETHMTVLA
ncbi:MAG: radical SAM protein, partial [Aliifodinibius sp.]|nr:radical SAM protein [Fodinibius sp.]NIV13202.1 radical SAM protein [Fodinibius sp.]NIY26867.1 radical SAM protein [Fodinibius sp.]